MNTLGGPRLPRRQTVVLWQHVGFSEQEQGGGGRGPFCGRSVADLRSHL
jgi:hypothetical protein